LKAVTIFICIKYRIYEENKSRLHLVLPFDSEFSVLPSAMQNC